VIAHRGASGERPENTLSAYELAVEQRADMIEIDLHQTRDGEVVITHDETLDHLGGRGAIENATFDEVRALDAGEGERVPTLAEVLDRFGPRIPFNLEIKVAPSGPYAGLEERSLEAVRSRGLLAETLFSSFSLRVLGKLKEIEPAARLALLVSLRGRSSVWERADRLRPEAVNPQFLLADRGFVAKAQAKGMKVFPYTADEPAQLRKLLDAGVDGIFTNFPLRLRDLLSGRPNAA